MLRRRFVSSSSSLLATQSAYLSSLRFCSSSSSSTSSKKPTATKMEAAAAANDDQINPTLQKCLDLDTKCAAWTLTNEDVKEALHLLEDLVNSRASLPPIKSHLDIIQYRDDDLVSGAEPRAIQVPYVISSLYRVLLNYNGWQTLTQISNRPQRDGTGPQQLERLNLKRLNVKDQNRFPPRELISKGLMCCSLPLNPKDVYKQYFMLGFPEDDPFKHIIAQGQNDANGTLAATKIAGYELMQFAERTPLVANKIQQHSSAAAAAAAALGKSTEKKPNQAETYTFEGIAVNTGDEKTQTAVLANTPDTLLMARRITKEATLETALVLAKSILEDESTSDENILYSEKYTRLANDIISIVSDDSSYYILQNNKGGTMIFTSMHHLHRFRRLSFDSDPSKWEEYGPWKIGATTGASIQWIDPKDENNNSKDNNKDAAAADQSKDLSHVINPTAIADYEAHDTMLSGQSKLPGFDVRFTRKTIELLMNLAAERKKSMA